MHAELTALHKNIQNLLVELLPLERTSKENLKSMKFVQDLKTKSENMFGTRDSTIKIRRALDEKLKNYDSEISDTLLPFLADKLPTAGNSFFIQV